MTWTIIKAILSDPEVISTALIIILAFMVKAKWVSEKDVATAKSIAHSIEGDVKDVASKVTDATGLTLPQAKEIVKEVKATVSGPDTNRKKIQRALRAILRGWLKF